MNVPHAWVIPVVALVMVASPTVLPAQSGQWELPSERHFKPRAPQAGQTFVDRVDVSDQAVTVRPVRQYAGYVMTVSGPDDFYMEQRFSATQIPTLMLRSSRGILRDGHYQVEITAQPIMSATNRAALQAARSTGDRAQVHQARSQAGIDEAAMKHAFGVTVAQGRFVDPNLTESAVPNQPVGASGARDALDAARALPPVRPVSIAADATDQAVPAGFEAGPRVSNASLNQALGAARSMEPLPAVVAASSSGAVPWTQATFRNVADDGSVVALQGYLRPVRMPGPGQSLLVEAYFRPLEDAGTSRDAWYRAYFQPSGDGFRLVHRSDVERRAGLFDYVASEDAADATAMPDQVILDDLIVDGSICVGLDCVNGESFGFDTIRLKENNLRIRFFDTSSSASFPTRDWQLTINDSSNGGAEKFSIDDIDGGRTPMTIRAGAPSHSLFVDSSGRLGLGTSTPVVEVHVKDGDTPTMRLEQDNSSGFQPQTWDLAGNETNFFVRDVTNGSRLPFRIRPGAATSAIDIDGSGNVRIGHSGTADALLSVKRTDGTAKIRVEETNTTVAGRALIEVRNNGPTRMQFNNTAASNIWNFAVDGGANFNLDKPGAANPGIELSLDGSGNLTVLGDLFSASCTSPTTPCGPDYVFEEDYPLLSLEELEAYIKEQKHLPNIPSAQEMADEGSVNVSRMQMRLLEKIEELTLYTIEQHKTLKAQDETIKELRARLAALEEAAKSRH